MNLPRSPAPRSFSLVIVARRASIVCACLLLGFASPAGEKIEFHPELGSSLQKTYTLKGDFELDQLSLVADGQDMAEMLGLELNMRTEAKFAVTDVIEALDPGRPKKLTRTFDDLEQLMHFNVSVQMGGEPQDEEVVMSSELEGETVVFTWNAEKEEFDISFQDSEGDASLLEGLTEDMDLRAFLPDHEVAEKDTWKVELANLHSIAMPGGDLRLMPEDAELDDSDFDFLEEIGEDFREKMKDLFQGECNCMFTGIREESGVRLGEIAIQIEVASTLDLTEILTELITKLAEFGGEMPEFSIDTADLNLDYDGEGILLWNIEGGRAHSFTLSGDAQIAFDISASVEAEGESHAFEASLEMSGGYEQALETGE